MNRSVAVIGVGSRGVGVLERIVSLSRLTDRPAPLRVELIDPRCDGAGVHATDQPDYLLLNTTAGAVSLFPDHHTVGDAVSLAGPSLLEWVTDRGLRLGEDGFTVSHTGRPIRSTDFLPRRVLGEYLGWVLDEVIAAAPPHVTITRHASAAVDLTPAADGDLEVTLADGEVVRVAQAFLTTGYTANADRTPKPGMLPGPYPLPGVLDCVAPGQALAIGGLGLSAMDVMSACTVGRGGRFVPDGDRLRYVPSGREPKLLFSSRTGVPCRARTKVVEFGPKYQPLVFTEAAIDALRAERGGPLDMVKDVLPLVFTEMRIAHRRRLAAMAGTELRLPHEDIPAALDELDRKHGAFDPIAAFDGSTGMPLDDRAAYQDWFADVVAADLAEGRRGLTGSPVKSALDILRDQRDMFRYVCDFGGLTPESLDEFTASVVPAINRAVVGPQFERHEELLALIAAGIAEVPFGPSPVATPQPDGRWRIASTMLATPHTRDVDWVLPAQTPLPAVAASADSLLVSLHRKGLIRRFRPDSALVPGVDVDADQHPVGADGRPERRIRVLGPLCEGATFYNNLVPSPGMWSRPVADAHRCVVAALADLPAAEPLLTAGTTLLTTAPEVTT
ncbi:FAD/NAD(P)-binding protein [Labedaea rhizosphaerae]|uniref:FAD-NAD(P)-binding protein n=1 Tax=Labedaea rhizosphaerae TaxID=598644 RepID=A0A4R6S377_LABRH|nr:FAD/NAD(P)-binding protein [Labedaea rhizosphaerae]TDP94062.1 FAD-NAD(P)-binding protein [Labedaea rhizosphaerae]